MPSSRGHEFQEPCWEAKTLGPGIKISVRYRDISHSLVCGRKDGSSKVLGISVATKITFILSPSVWCGSGNHQPGGSPSGWSSHVCCRS